MAVGQGNAPGHAAAGHHFLYYCSIYHGIVKLVIDVPEETVPSSKISGTTPLNKKVSFFTIKICF